MTWHLFKGGVRTELIDKLQLNRVFDEAIKRIEIEKGTILDATYHALEAYQDRQEAQEDSGLRKRRQSISNIIKGAEEAVR